MIGKTITNSMKNGKENGVNRIVSQNSPKFWEKFQINEQTFTFFLFALSFSIVVGKMFINYGDATEWTTKVQNRTSSLSTFSKVYDVFAIGDSQKLSDSYDETLKISSENLMNIGNGYADAITGAVVGFLQRFGWLLKASFFGLAMMAFTWFIIYQDSNIPGVNPPLPFSPSKRQYPEQAGLQINYLMGALNGILVFIYTCL